MSVWLNTLMLILNVLASDGWSSPINTLSGFTVQKLLSPVIIIIINYSRSFLDAISWFVIWIHKLIKKTHARKVVDLRWLFNGPSSRGHRFSVSFISKKLFCIPTNCFAALKQKARHAKVKSYNVLEINFRNNSGHNKSSRKNQKPCL